MDIEFPSGGHAHQHGKFTRSDYDFVQDAPDKKCLYCISEAQKRALLPLLETMGWKTRWFSPTNVSISQDYITSLRDSLIGELMADHCDIDGLLTDIKDVVDGLATSLAELTTTVNEMEEDVDHIETLVEAIDCGGATVINYEVINTYTDNFQISVVLAALAAPAPGLPDKVWLNKTVTPNAQYAAWCTLVVLTKRWVQTCMYRFLYIINPANSSLGSIYAALTTAGGYFAGSVFDPAQFVTAPTESEAEAAATDSTALTNVICDMARALVVNSLSFDGWQTAIASLSYTSGTNENIIQTVVQSAAILDNVIQANYAGFINQWQPVYDKEIAQLPTSFTCEGCTLEPPCSYQTWDFRTLDYLPWVIDRGVITPNGLSGVYTDYDPTSVGIDVSIYFPTPCSLFGYSVAFLFKFGHFSYPDSSFNNKLFWEAYSLISGVEVLTAYNYVYNDIWPPNGGVFTETVYPAAFSGHTEPLYRLRLCTNTPYYGHGGVNHTAAVLQRLEMTV